MDLGVLGVVFGSVGAVTGITGAWLGWRGDKTARRALREQQFAPVRATQQARLAEIPPLTRELLAKLEELNDAVQAVDAEPENMAAAEARAEALVRQICDLRFRDAEMTRRVRALQVLTFGGTTEAEMRSPMAGRMSDYISALREIRRAARDGSPDHMDQLQRQIGRTTEPVRDAQWLVSEAVRAVDERCAWLDVNGFEIRDGDDPQLGS